MRVNGTLVEDKMRRFKGECEHFSFNKCPIYTHDGASANFSTNSQEMDNSAARIQRKTWCMGPFAGFDYNSPYVPSRVDSNTFTMGNPMPESTLTLCLLYPPVRDFGFSLWADIYGQVMGKKLIPRID